MPLKEESLTWMDHNNQQLEYHSNSLIAMSFVHTMNVKGPFTMQLSWSNNPGHMQIIVKETEPEPAKNADEADSESSTNTLATQNKRDKAEGTAEKVKHPLSPVAPPPIQRIGQNANVPRKSYRAGGGKQSAAKSSKRASRPSKKYYASARGAGINPPPVSNKKGEHHTQRHPQEYITGLERRKMQFDARMSHVMNTLIGKPYRNSQPRRTQTNNNVP